MKKTTIKNSLIATMAVCILAIALPSVVSAQPTRPQDTETAAQQRRDAAQQRREMIQTTESDKKEAAQTRLADARLKACQKRERTVTNIMSRMGDRGQKQIDLFTKIAEKTQTFYIEKGKILNGYDTLVADVTAMRVGAQNAVNTTRGSVVEFKCDGTDPKGAAASFKEKMKAQNTALKAYRTAVKSLIVGVKSVQGSTASAENSAGGEQ